VPYIVVIRMYTENQMKMLIQVMNALE